MILILILILFSACDLWFTTSRAMRAAGVGISLLTLAGNVHGSESHRKTRARNGQMIWAEHFWRHVPPNKSPLLVEH